MIRRYRKKPVVVDAVQLTATNFEEVLEFLGNVQRQISPDGKSIRIFTLEGAMLANLNDWIIRGVEGEFYPCKPNIFELCYEEAS